MRSLEELLRLNKTIRVIGFDDAPFERENSGPVQLAGVICADTRFEGMIWGDVTRDGVDATEVLVQLLRGSKFYPQVNVVLLDGIALGGFNIIDLPKLSQLLSRPCITVMRHFPDMQAIDKALKNLSDYELRQQRLAAAGTIYQHQNFYYQVSGCEPASAARLLERVTDKGHVPEALRLAHLIGAAVINGQSSHRA